MEENEKNLRESFIFYKTFYDCIKNLPQKSQNKIYSSVCEYVFFGKIIELNGLENGIFSMIKAQLDANNRRCSNGKNGGRPRKNAISETDDKKPMVLKNDVKIKTNGFENNTENKNQRLSKDDVQKKPNENVNDNVNENVNVEKESKKEKEIAIIDSMIDSYNISEPLLEKVKEWLDYKKQRKESYIERGLKSLLTQISKQAKEHGDIAVMDIIDFSMANGYKGILWDKIGKGGNGSFVDEWRNA